MSPSARKPLYFIGSSWKDLKRLPGTVQDTFGTLLLDVQYGETPASAKPLKPDFDTVWTRKSWLSACRG